MKRDYKDCESDSAVYFYGQEVEHTPAYGLPTLFVTGVQPIDDIARMLSNTSHIFFGANHSFDPLTQGWEGWESMIQFFLDKGYLCSLDIPLSEIGRAHV